MRKEGRQVKTSKNKKKIVNFVMKMKMITMMYKR